MSLHDITLHLMAGASRSPSLEGISRFLGDLPEGKRYVIRIRERQRRRTISQNKYLWGVVYEVLRQETGQSREDWHEYFLGEYFGWRDVKMFGRTVIKPRRRSSRLSSKEFWDYVSYVHRKAAENGIYIPDPGEDIEQDHA